MEWGVLIILFIATGAATLGNGLVVPLLPAYAHSIGATGMVIGLIFGAFSLPRTFLLPVIGRLSDKFGRKPFITIGLLCYFLLSVLYIIAANLYWFVIIRFLQGAASALILPVAQAYAGEITVENREGMVMGYLHMALYCGLCVGPVMGGIIKDTFGINWSFMSMGFVFMLGFLLCLLKLPPRKSEKIRPIEKEKAIFFNIITGKAVSGLFIFRLFYTVCIGVMWTFIPLIAATVYHMNSFYTGLIIALSVLVSAIVTVPMGYLADVFSKRILISTGGLFTAFAMIWFSCIHSKGELYAASMLIGAGGGIAIPSMMAMIVVIGKEQGSMGSVISMLTMAHSIGFFIGPVMAGALVDAYGMNIVFLGSGIMMIITAVATLPLTRSYRETKPSEDVIAIIEKTEVVD